MSKADAIAADRLKSFAQRIERLMDERDGIQSDIRDIYAEAKGVGYVPKVLRKAITRKRMDPDKRDEEDTILDLYEGALSGPMRKAVSMAAKGATARQIEAQTGIDQATVARSVSLNKKSETPPHTADGVITETKSNAAGGSPGDEGDENGSSGCNQQRSSGGEGERRGEQAPGKGAGGIQAPGHAADRTGDGAEDVPERHRAGGGLADQRCGETDGLHSGRQDADEAHQGQVAAPDQRGVEPASTPPPPVPVGAQAEPEPVKDDLEFPAFLDVRKSKGCPAGAGASDTQPTGVSCIETLSPTA